MTVALSPLAFQNAELLIALDTSSHENWTALAASIEKDASNVRKSAAKLADEGLVETLLTSPLPVLTEQGRAAVAAYRRAIEGGGVRHDLIDPDPDNPRKDFTSPDARSDLDDLRGSIVAKGLLQPIVLRPHPDVDGRFMIVAGERRWRAIGEAIADADWPAERPVPADVRNVTAAQARAMAIIENVQRRSLNRVEEGRAYKTMMELDGLTAQQVADTVDKTAKHVTDHIKLVTELSEADLARIVLPKDDPNRLSYKDARLKWRGHEEGSAPPPKAAAPEPAPQLDLSAESGGDDDNTPEFLRRLAGPGSGPEASPTSPPNPAPKPERQPLHIETLPPAQRLILVELAHKVATDPAAEGYQRTEVAPDAGGADIEALTQQQLISLFHIHATDGRSYASIGYSAGEQVKALFPGIFGKEPDRALEAAQFAIDEDAIKHGFPGRYITPWLNGPFDLSEEGQAWVAAQDAKAEAARLEAEQKAAEREAADQAERDFLVRVQEALAGDAESLGQRVRALLEDRHPLPWRVAIERAPMRPLPEGMIRDALDGTPSGYGDGLTAVRLLYAAAVHHLVGLPLPDLIDLPAEPDPEASAEDAEAGQ